MAILKKEYELSVWDETLGEKGQKEEIKRAIIGAHDMSYGGRATALKLSRKINGTNVLTFQMPSKYFDSKSGKYIHNEFCDYIFNERKLKLKYDGEWFEFYVKNINENKQFKSIMYQYQCEDAFIDELSRNGYGITFDTELYNNVEEIGLFTEQILENSVWQYDASKNWGDFTEYSEEKLFKIPISMFSEINGYKLNYKVDGKLTNPFSGESRTLEMGDDLSREKKYFWDNGKFDSGISLLKNKTNNIPNDGYIYIPYSCLDFCYINNTKGGEGYAATQEAVIDTINGYESYCLAPSSIDPTYLIQFIAIPPAAEILIDEAGLIVNKDYTYVMTLADWNKNVTSDKWYNPENHKMEENLVSNKVVCYDGYLDKIGDTDITFGKKISITDRTEINISEDIDQYVTVYNNSQEEYKEMFSSEDWVEDNKNYRICSYEETRMIVPQLARNLVQNGTEMTDTSGWEVMKVLSDVGSVSSTITVRPIKEDDEKTSGGLLFLPRCRKLNETIEEQEQKLYTTFINFGIVGQEEEISKEQTYILRFDGLPTVAEEKIINGSKEIVYHDELKVGLKTHPTLIIGEGGYDSDGDYTISEQISIQLEPKKTFFIRPDVNIKNPYIALRFNETSSTDNMYYNLKELTFAKAYTKGIDFFEKGHYKYTGRDIFFNKDNPNWISIKGGWKKEAKENEYLKETDIVEGDVYSYKRYYRQQIQVGEETKDTFMLKSYLNNDIEKNGFDPTEYTEDDFKIITDYIDLNKCKYYNFLAAATEKDCKHTNSTNGLCMYQKYGYCPYQFQTQKHCRKIRTLNGEKSNRFNLTQELSKVFEVYPVYYIEHMENGKIVTDLVEDENKQKYKKMRKKVFYITEKGVENKLGFRYEKNLSDISRTFNSKEIVTKLYVEDVDSELSKTGLCSIKTAEDNPSKDSYIIDFSYYTMRGLLDEATTNADLYGINNKDMGYLKKLGYYNREYDRLSNLIINLQDESYTELEANIEVNLTGIETAQKELNKIKKNMTKYSSVKNNKNEDITGKTIEASDTYNNYKIKYDEQKSILLGLIKDTFMTDGKFDDTLPITFDDDTIWAGDTTSEQLMDKISKYGFKKFKEDFLDTFKYRNYGLMGQFTSEYLQIQKWKKERAKYLKDINRISLEFYQKYEPYLKEGTWSDNNYLSDNTYYFGAKEVAKQGAIPKITYNISVIDLSILDNDYKVGVADSTYIEDVEIFGINQKTGLPNRLKAIISGITYDLDIPSQNSLEIQNYTTQFEDLFQQVSATVQSLSFNENIYKRSSNFTATKNISEESLQGGLLNNQLTLLETDEKNILLDQTGQSGSDINNHANRYKLSGEGLFFSNNGGQTWNVGVTPKGINADYINVGSLDASKISIVDGNYLYFLWDKGGITAYREPQATNGTNYFQDFARFNKYGLSLVENGKIKLRAGYQYQHNSSIQDGESGKISEEAEINGDTALGFYLYNSEGQEIFATQTHSKGEAGTVVPLDEQESARLKLAGEIYASESALSAERIPMSTTKKYKYSYNGDDLTLQLTKPIYYTLKLPYNKSVYYSEHQAMAAYLNGEIKDGYEIIDVNNQNSSYTMYISNLKKEGELVKNAAGYFKDGEDIKIFYQYTLLVSAQLSYNDQTSAEKTEAQKYTITYYDTRNVITQDFWSENNSFFERQQVGTFYLLAKSLRGGTESEINFQYITLDYYIKSDDNVQLAKDETKYYFDSINLYAYPKQEEITQGSSDSDGGKDGLTELYINNKRLLQNKNNITPEERQAERLFCCARYQKDVVQNLFTVLKNGELFIGGLIEPYNNSNIIADGNMPPAIKIKDAGIKLTQDEIFMDFGKFRDMSSGENLLDTINSTVANASIGRHAHEIINLTVQMDKIPEDCSCLPNKKTMQNWKNAVGNNIENLISLLAGQTISKGSGEYNPVGNMSTNIAPMEVSFELNATGSRTEFAGDSAGAQTYSYTYTDPVEGDEE